MKPLRVVYEYRDAIFWYHESIQKIEMHNNIIKNVVSKERTPLKANSVAKLIFEL